jgi:LysR family hydrogen peroxide-inducible transcriptional activator
VVAQPLNIANAYRRVSLVYRQSFPRLDALHALAQVILDNLPNTVNKVGRRRAACNSQSGKK